MPLTKHLYVIAAGSNRWHPRLGGPRRVIAAAAVVVASRGITVLKKSRIIDSAPLGPSRRRFANVALLIEAPHDPLALLRLLQQMELDFGRRRAPRWSARVLDLDIILWSGGLFQRRDLTIPHPAWRDRTFVLEPAREIVPHWRDPVSLRTTSQLRVLLRKERTRAGD